MPKYALAARLSGVDLAIPAPGKKVKHVCGEELTPVKGSPGRYMCTRCLQTGYLLLPD